MLMVCRHHVKEGVGILHAPHIKQVKGDDHKCSFVSCTNYADYKLFSPTNGFHKRVVKSV